MGECIISRHGGQPEEKEVIIPISDRCILDLTVLGKDDVPLCNIPIICKDGASTYTYNTKEKGKVRFSTNSGQATITFNNKLSNGCRVLDYNTQNFTQEAMVGTVVNNTIKLVPCQYPANTPGKVCVLSYNYVNVFVAGGGGGGGGASICDDDGAGAAHYQDVRGNGGSGGTGMGNWFNKILLSREETYSISIGNGGNGGKGNFSRNSTMAQAGNGYTGITSYAFNKSQVGGGGGGGAYSASYSRPTHTDGTKGTSYSGGGSGGYGGEWTSSTGNGGRGSNGTVKIYLYD